MVLGTEPAAALYAIPPDRYGLVEEASRPFRPDTGLEAFRKVAEARLLGRPLAGLSVYPWERTVLLSFGPREGLRGSPEPAYLVHEAAPKPARLILLGPDRTVAASWPPAPAGDGGDSEPRLRRGSLYTPPPAPWKLSPTQLAADEAEFARVLAASEREEPGDPETLPPWRALLKAAPPIGPGLAKQIAGAGGRAGLHEAFRRAVAHYPAGPFAPGLSFSKAGDPAEVVALPPLGGGSDRQAVATTSIGDALAAWQVFRRVRGLEDALAATLRRTIRSALARARRKVARQAEDLDRAGDADDLRRRGELLLAHLHEIEPRRPEATVLDYEGQPVTIALDPRLSPARNAQRYFRRYRKAQRAAELEGPRRKAAYELAWLESMLYDLEQATAAAEHAEAEELPGGVAAAQADPGTLGTVWRRIGAAAGAAQELRNLEASLTGAGYLPKARPARGPATTGTTPPASPLEYVTGDGLTVLAGRSARQNETLSLKTAQPGDLWFHARNCPGSHVVLRLPPGMPAAEAPSGSVLQAAALAVRLSAARGGGKVAVDYTEARNLRRPRGAPPGLVLYDPHKTILVDTGRVSLPGLPGRIRGSTEE